MGATMSIDTVLAAMVTGAIFAFVYGGYHYWQFVQKLEQGQMSGMIPPPLQRRRMGIGWMIASPGIVPAGDVHRRKSIYSLAIFVSLLLACLLIRILFPIR
jgi:hypothetical protein